MCCRHPRPGKWQITLLTLSSLAFMLPWQFAQFVLLTQQLSLAVVYSLGLVGPAHFLSITLSITLALLANIALQFANTLLLTSFLPPCLLTCLVSVLRNNITLHIIIHKHIVVIFHNQSLTSWGNHPSACSGTSTMYIKLMSYKTPSHRDTLRCMCIYITVNTYTRAHSHTDGDCVSSAVYQNSMADSEISKFLSMCILTFSICFPTQLCEVGSVLLGTLLFKPLFSWLLQAKDDVS